MIMVNDYEFTPRQSAEKLMNFIRDMGDDEDQIEQEKKIHCGVI